MSVYGCCIPSTTIFSYWPLCRLCRAFTSILRFRSKIFGMDFQQLACDFLSCLTSMFRASSSEALFKGARELSLLVGLAADFNCKDWVTRTIFLMMAMFELPSSCIISNPRRIKALSWFRTHALVMTWDIWTCHGLACADQPRFWMHELVIA